MSFLMTARRRGGRGAVGPGGPVALTLSRQDGGSGSTLVTTGIPLYAGELTSGNLGQCSLWINGSEVSCYLEALRGTHADGSVQWLLVQWTGNPATVSSCELRLSGGSGVGRATKVTPPRVPTTFFVAPTARLCNAPRRPFRNVPVGDPALPSWLSQWDSLYADRIAFERTQSTSYQEWQTRLGGAAPYDFGASTIRYGMRTGNALYWHHTLTTGQTMTTNSQSYSWVASNTQDFVLVETWTWVWCYWMTGNPDYLQALAFHTRRQADIAAGNNQLPAGTASDSNTGPGDNRSPARTLDGYMASLYLGLTSTDFGVSTFNSGAQGWTTDLSGLQQFVNDTFTIVTTDGRWGGTIYTESSAPNRIGQKPFMVAMLTTALVRYDELFGDSRVNTMVPLSISWMRTNDWDASPPIPGNHAAFAYVTYNVDANNQRWDAASGAGGDNLHGLNNFQAYWMARRARIANDTELRSFIQTFVNSCYQNRAEWINQTPAFATKQFDESYVYLWEAQYEIVQMG